MKNYEKMTKAELLEELRKKDTIEIIVSTRAGLEEHRLATPVEAARESEQTLKTLMELMPVAVGWFDDDGNIQYLNRCFVELLGYTLADIPTLDEWYVHAYPDPAYREALLAEWNAALAEGKSTGSPVSPVEVRITCKDGTVRHIIANTLLARNRTVVIFTDITEREYVQNERIKAQKLESLGVLARGIAHDFNNIHTSILGNISFARMLLDDSHKVYKLLGEAEKASARATELSLQLLTFAKGGNPVKKIVSVGNLVKESVTLALRGSNVRGVIDVSDAVHAIEADEGQMNQAFNNIIINAVHAMPGGGTLIVRAENVTLDNRNKIGLRPGEYVKISFIDEGCGIPEEDQPKIFDPYFSTKRGGTGMGLSSVYSIISKHKGRVDVLSETGKGSTFCCYLPSTGGGLPELRPVKESIAIGSHTGGSILVMDDEEMIRNIVTEILQHLGYKVTTCINGQEAISLYKAAQTSGTPFSAVIMDLTIPGSMGAREAARHILAIDPAARLIVSSGYSNDPIIAEFKKYGFSAAVTKPYNAKEMARIFAVKPNPQTADQDCQ